MDVTWQVAGPLRLVYGYDRPVAAFLLHDCPQPIPTANTRNNDQKRKENEIRLAEMCLIQEDKCLCRLSLVPGIHGQRKERLVSAVFACAKFSQKCEKPCCFDILPRNGHLQRQ